MDKIYHPIAPLYDENSKILILGSFPSVKSREQKFFYGHPQNRFWPLWALLFSEDCPETVEEKRDFALHHHIAMWDVLASCTISGSADSTIRNVTANDIRPILETADIKNIFVNGKTAEKYYIKYILPVTGREAVCLPSTSPANAAYSLERLAKEWNVAKNDIVT